MKDIRTLGYLAIPLALAIPGIASAQDREEKPYQIKVGLSRWTSGEVRDFAGGNTFNIGFGYRLPSRSFLSAERGRSYIEVDYLRADDDGDRADSFGLWYTERVALSEPVAGQKGMFYGGLGVGVTFNGAKLGRDRNGGGGGGNNGGGGSSGGGSSAQLFDFNGNRGDSFRNTRIGFLALLGYEFDRSFFVEAQYRFGGSLEGNSMDSIGLMLGFRF